MIHYHGLPITADTVCAATIQSGHAFVSFNRPEQLNLVLECCQSFAVDNGAFSAWKTGSPVTDWTPYYEFIKSIKNYPSFDFCVIPDDIDGGEKENDDLLAQWPFKYGDAWVGAPVWHLHENKLRLSRLASAYPRVCIGSSGDYAQIGTRGWWSRMSDAMVIVTAKHGIPITKLHGLRMLDPEIFTRFPFSSADSTNIARNVGIDSRWNGSYAPPTKEARAMIMRQRIESRNAPPFWNKEVIQVKQSGQLSMWGL